MRMTLFAGTYSRKSVHHLAGHPSHGVEHPVMSDSALTTGLNTAYLLRRQRTA